MDGYNGEADSVHCLGKILTWYGGQVSLGLLNWWFALNYNDGQLLALEKCAERIGLRLVRTSYSVLPAEDGVYIAVGGTGRSLAIRVGSVDVIIFDPMVGERTISSQPLRVPPGVTVYTAICVSPINFTPSYKLVKFGLLPSDTCQGAVIPNSWNFDGPNRAVPPDGPLISWPMIVRKRLADLGGTGPTWGAITPELVKVVHKSLADGILDAPGVYRSEWFKRRDQVFVPPAEISAVMSQWCIAAQQVRELVRSQNVWVQARMGARLLSDFAGIHPFVDFNGKMALLMTSIMIGSPKLRSLPAVQGTPYYYAAVYAALAGRYGLLAGLIRLAIGGKHG